MAYISILIIVLYVALVVLGIWILWSLVRSAVRRALRDHQLWLDSRGVATGSSIAADDK